MNILAEISSIAAVSGAFGVVFAASETWQRVFRTRTEVTRKFVHVMAGLLALSFPYVFQSAWTVIGLAVVFAVLLLVARSYDVLKSINDVERISWGEVFFPVAIAVTFGVASATDTMEFYLIAILVLAISDALAGMVGEAWGRIDYRIGRATKTLEGSAAFFLSSVILVFVGASSLLGLDPSAAMIVALATAASMTLLEALMPYGTDNLVLPIGTWCVLQAIV